MLRKGILLLSILVMIGAGIGHATSSLDAFRWAHDQQLISLDSQLQGSSHIQRQQFAPLLLSYLDRVAQKSYIARSCISPDIQNADTSYRDAIEKLCSYGLMRGEQGKIYPFWKLTRGQAIALIMRSIDGLQSESTAGGRHRAQGYFDRARQLGYWVGDMDAVKNIPISYEELVSFLYATRHPNQMISLSVVESAVNQSSMSFNSSDDALRRLAEIMAS